MASNTRTRFALGVVAILCYMTHAMYHVYHGSFHDLLWACHLGAALVGVGLISGTVWISAVGTLFLCLGTPQWLLYLASGGQFMPTSVATHVFALGIGLFAACAYGVPRGTWWKSLVGLVLLIVTSRLITPREANVNVAFAVQPGWESHFSSYPTYITLMVALAGVCFWLTEKVLQRLRIAGTRKKTQEESQS